VALDLGLTEQARQHLAGSLRLSQATGARIGVARGLARGSADAVALALDEDGSDGADGPTLSVVRAYEVAAAPPGSLTPREHEIAALIATGRSNKAIAAELSISPTTAARHVANILAKLGFKSRTQIAAWVADRSSAADGPT
jgi:DNA-binding NarL/FixJ family response regulator